jgi:hypothetical protein
MNPHGAVTQFADPILRLINSTSYVGFSWCFSVETHKDVASKCRDSYKASNFLSIQVSPPYLKPSEVPVNEFGLPNRTFYTTADICKVLNYKPDTLRYKIRRGHYPEVVKVGGKRRFQIDQIKNILEITAELLKRRILLPSISPQ